MQMKMRMTKKVNEKRKWDNEQKWEWYRDRKGREKLKIGEIGNDKERERQKTWNIEIRKREKIGKEIKKMRQRANA